MYIILEPIAHLCVANTRLLLSDFALGKHAQGVFQLVLKEFHLVHSVNS